MEKPIVIKYPDENKPLIFLDIDEVCNSLSYRCSLAYDINKRDIMTSRTDTRTYKLERKAADLDPTATGLILTLAQEMNASIVIVSTWRKIIKPHEFKRIFELAGFDIDDDLFAGCTDGRSEMGVRLAQCQDWRKAAGHKGPWICIDDSTPDYPDQSHLIAPDPHLGFGYHDYNNALERLRHQLEKEVEVSDQQALEPNP